MLATLSQLCVPLESEKPQPYTAEKKFATSKQEKNMWTLLSYMGVVRPMLQAFLGRIILVYISKPVLFAPPVARNARRCLECAFFRVRVSTRTMTWHSGAGRRSWQTVWIVCLGSPQYDQQTCCRLPFVHSHSDRRILAS